MPELIDPGTKSPGRVIVYYRGNGINEFHSTSAKLLSGRMPVSQETAQTLAQGFADAIATALIPDAYTATYWRIVNELDLTVFEGPCDTGTVGTAETPDPAPPVDLSLTISYGGRGMPFEDPGLTLAGQEKLTLFAGGSYAVAPGQKRILLSEEVGLTGLSGFLAGNADLWADFYGQPASVRNYVNVQYNARAQRTHGT